MKRKNVVDDWVKKNTPQQIVTETDKVVYMDDFKVGFISNVESKNDYFKIYC